MTQTYAMLKQAADVASEFLAELPGRRVFPDSEALARIAAFDPPVPNDGQPGSAIIEALQHLSRDGVVATAGPRYFGYVTGGALPAAVAASWLVTAWDQPPTDPRLAPLATRLEEITGKWLLELLRLPKGSSVNYVTGTTMASFVGLAAARDTVLSKVQWSVQSRGLIGAPPIRVVVGEEAHPTLYKVLGMLGLGRDTAIHVPVDAQGRMRADLLPTLDENTILCLQIGNVNSGSVDPLAEIIPAAKKAGAWVHIDGAFGLVAAASPARANLLAGHDLADSWAVDGHKWLNTPYDCGVAICRWPEAVSNTFHSSGAYLEQSAAVARNFVPEMSRRARSVEMFAALSSLGRSGLEELVERCCAHARRFADGLRALGYEVLNDVVLNQCIATIGSPAQVQSIFEHIQNSGEAWLSTSDWKGRFCLRISVSNWSTTTVDVDRTLAAIANATNAVMKQSVKGPGERGDG